MRRISTLLVTAIVLVACVLAPVDTLRAKELQFDLQRREPQTAVEVRRPKVDVTLTQEMVVFRRVRERF